MTTDPENEIEKIDGQFTAFVDPAELNGTYTYIVDAVLDDGEETVTPPSNMRTITVTIIN